MVLSTNTENAKVERMSRLGLLKEPVGYVEGQNLYEYCKSGPNNAVDPEGTDSRAWEYIDCVDDCMRFNDPVDPALGAALAFLAGHPLPKAFVARLAEFVGDPILARRIRGGSAFTTIPSVVSTRLRLNGRSALRMVGRYAAPVMVAYGLAQAAVHVHCFSFCCGIRNFDPTTGSILDTLRDEYFSDF